MNKKKKLILVLIFGCGIFLGWIFFISHLIMNTLLNDRAFMAQFEKSKLETKQKAQQRSDMMVEDIYEQMLVDLSGWLDTNQRVKQQQREQEKLQLQEQALPFIIETDGTTEACAQIAASDTSSKLNSEAALALQNEPSSIIEQESPPIQPPVVKEEFTDSVTVIEEFPSSSKIPKENNAILSNHTTPVNVDAFENTVVRNNVVPSNSNSLLNLVVLQNDTSGNNVGTPTQNKTSSSNPSTNNNTKPSTTVCPIITTTSGATFILLTPTAGQTQRKSPLPPTSTLVPVNNNQNNYNIVRLQSSTLSGQQQPSTSPSSTPPTSLQLVKYQPIMTRIDTRNNVGNIIIDNKDNKSGINGNFTKSNIIIAKKFYGRRNQQIVNKTNNFHINKKNSNIINREINNHNKQSITSICIANDNDAEMNCGCPECLFKEEESIYKIGHSKHSLEEGSFEDANNVEMVEALHEQEVDARLFECSNCNLRFITDSDLQAHSTVHNHDLLFKCGLCQNQFRCKRTFEHLASRTVHKHHTKIFTCSICSKQFNRSSNYARHLASVHSVGESNCKYACRFCERKFYYDSVRVRHETAVHHKIRPFRCAWEGCQFGSANRENVVSHVRSIHFGVPQKEQRKMVDNGGGVLEFDKYVRKVIHSVAVKRRVKTKK